MMIFILILTYIISGGTLLLVGYCSGYGRGYKRGRKEESDYWYRTCRKVNKKGSM